MIMMKLKLLKEKMNTKKGFEINEFREIIRPQLDTTDSPKQSKEIDEELEQWLNAGKTKTDISRKSKDMFIKTRYTIR